MNLRTEAAWEDLKFRIVPISILFIACFVSLGFPSRALGDYYGYWKLCETCPLRGPACWDTGLPPQCPLPKPVPANGGIEVDFWSVDRTVFSGFELKEAKEFFQDEIQGPVELLADNQLYEVRRNGRRLDISRAVSQSQLSDLDLEAQRRAQEIVATNQFLGLNWALGIGVASDLGGSTRVDKASLVNGIVRVEEESDTQARIFLEIHMFGLRRKQQDDEPKPLFGQGPWIGIQSSKSEMIDSFGLGWMWGWRKAETDTRSFNIGIGIVLDPKVQVLGEGIAPNQPLPGGETAIRFKNESRLNAALLVSFNF
jgi:hypothetical protein